MHSVSGRSKLTLSKKDRTVTAWQLYENTQYEYKVLVWHPRYGFKHAEVRAVLRTRNMHNYSLRSIFTKTLYASSKTQIAHSDGHQRAERAIRFLYLDGARILEPYVGRHSLEKMKVGYEIFTDSPEYYIIVNGYFLKQRKLEEVLDGHRRKGKKIITERRIPKVSERG